MEIATDVTQPRSDEEHRAEGHAQLVESIVVGIHFVCASERYIAKGAESRKQTNDCLGSCQK